MPATRVKYRRGRLKHNMTRPFCMLLIKNTSERSVCCLELSAIQAGRAGALLKVLCYKSESSPATSAPQCLMVSHSSAQADCDRVWSCWRTDGDHFELGGPAGARYCENYTALSRVPIYRWIFLLSACSWGHWSQWQHKSQGCINKSLGPSTCQRPGHVESPAEFAGTN